MSHFNVRTNTLVWNPKMGLVTDLGVVLSPAAVLGHEAQHVVEQFKNPKKNAEDNSTKDNEFKNKAEKKIVQGVEEIIAQALGIIKPGQKTRGPFYPKAVLITNHPFSQVGTLINPVDVERFMEEYIRKEIERSKAGSTKKKEKKTTK